MATLRTNYKDDILAAAMDGKRQYQMINNPNGTVSFVDVTDYTQNGDTFSSGDVNAIDAQVNTNTNYIDDIVTQVNAIISNAPQNITSRLANLSTAIAEQKLEKYGYKIGDYFVGASGYTYWIADLDPFFADYVNPSHQIYLLGTHHVGIVVDTHQKSMWNATYQSIRYGDSTIYSYITGTVLNNVKSDFASLFNGWEDHLLAKTMSDGYLSIGRQYITPLTEYQVYGTYGISHNTLLYTGREDTQGDGIRQLEIFRKYHYCRLFPDEMVWLRNRYNFTVEGTDNFYASILDWKGGFEGIIGRIDANLTVVGLIFMY